MSFPETCPHCDAGPGQYLNSYLCGTYLRPNVHDRTHQANRCAVLERARLSARVAELERDIEQAKADRARAAMDARNPLMAQLAELEERCKRLEEAAREVYLDSIASDHPWTELETRNMHALRDVLEAKP